MLMFKNKPLLHLVRVIFILQLLELLVNTTTNFDDGVDPENPSWCPPEYDAIPIGESCSNIERGDDGGKCQYDPYFCRNELLGYTSQFYCDENLVTWVGIARDYYCDADRDDDDDDDDSDRDEGGGDDDNNDGGDGGNDQVITGFSGDDDSDPENPSWCPSDCDSIPIGEICSKINEEDDSNRKCQYGPYFCRDELLGYTSKFYCDEDLGTWVGEAHQYYCESTNDGDDDDDDDDGNRDGGSGDDDDDDDDENNDNNNNNSGVVVGNNEVNNDDNVLGCFSSENKVLVVNKGYVSMDQLQIGDTVQVGKGEKFSRIYSFGHYSRHTKAEYLQFHLENNKNNNNNSPPLEITENHMVFVVGKTHRSNSNNPIPASGVSVGDYLVTISDDDNSKRIATTTTSRVIAIKKVNRIGAYAPFTETGTIVVNNVLASSYVSLQDNETSGNLVLSGIKVISMHWLAHTLQVPHRLFCQINSFCSNEKYTEKEGISYWVYGLLIISKWLLQREHIIILSILTIPLILLAIVLQVVEFVFIDLDRWIITLFVAVTLSVIWGFPRQKKDTRRR